MLERLSLIKTCDSDHVALLLVLSHSITLDVQIHAVVPHDEFGVLLTVDRFVSYLSNRPVLEFAWTQSFLSLPGLLQSRSMVVNSLG